MTRLASVILGDGSRRAAVIEGEEAWVSEVTGIDAALASGVTLAGLSDSAGRSAAVQDLVFDAPLRPPVIFCLGQNYRDHLDEKAHRTRRNLRIPDSKRDGQRPG
jgi:hypothetical protein